MNVMNVVDLQMILLLHITLFILPLTMRGQRASVRCEELEWVQKFLSNAGQFPSCPVSKRNLRNYGRNVNSSKSFCQMQDDSLSASGIQGKLKREQWSIKIHYTKLCNVRRRKEVQYYNLT